MLPGFLVTLAAGAVVLAVVLVTSSPSSSPSSSSTLPPATSDDGFPPPQTGATTPLGAPPSVPEGGSYAFRKTQDGTDEPVAWDPCRPIAVVVDDRAAPDGGADLLAAALDEVSRATGLAIEVEGPTDEEPSVERALVVEDRYGDRWAPVLVSWTEPEAVPALEGDVGGLGGSRAVRAPDGTEVYVTGTLLLDGPQMGESLRVTGGMAQVRSVILHEMGHVVGLAHVDDPAELMHAEGQPGASDYGPGDRAGLARLGRGRCVPDL